MGVSFDQRVSVPDHVLQREVREESVLLNMETEDYFGLDGTGTAMFDALRSEASIEAAATRLLGEFDVAEDELRSDLASLVEQLADAGLVDIDG